MKRLPSTEDVTSLARHLAVMDGLRPDDMIVRGQHPTNTSVGPVVFALDPRPAWHLYIDRAQSILDFLAKDQP